MSRRHTSRTGTDPSEAAATALAPANKHLAAQKLAAAVRPVFELLEGRQLLNGALDPTFGVAGKAVTDFGGAQDIGSGLAVLADGSFVVVGESGGQFAVAKYTANGALDTGFGGGDGLVTTAIGSIARATSVAIDGSGRIIVGGYATVGTTEDFAVARYDAGGNLDTSFGGGDGVATTDFANRRDHLFALTILPSGQIVAVGQVRTGAADNNEDFGVAVYHPATGVLDTTFDTDGKATTDFGGEEDARGVAYDAALGRIVVVGESDGTFALAGYVAATGALDGGFDGDGRLTTIFPGSAIAMSAAIDSNGRYVVAGGSGADFAVARYANTGALDAGFDSDGMLTLDFAGGFDHANAVALAAAEKILVAGVASNGGSGDFGVARLTSSGALDPTFGLGTGKVATDIAGNSDTAAAVAVQPTSGKLLVVGTGNGGGASQDDFATVRLDGAQAAAWVNDNWTITNDVAPAGLSFGDTVENTGAGDTGAPVTKIFGFDAFNSITAALESVVGGATSTVHVEAGTYQASDVVVDKDVTIDGYAALPSQVVVGPAVADGHLTAAGSTFNPASHNAFVILSGGVSLRDLTIDGDAGVGGAGSMNYFGGVVYDYRPGQAFNNLAAENLTVRNVWRVGIYFDGGLNALSTGHTVSGNTVANVSGGTGASGILMLQASGAVTGNTITGVDGDGIATNYIDGVAYAPTITIRGNTIGDTNTGMNLSGLAAGSAVGGAGANEGNTITMSGGGDETGVIIQYATGVVTVEGNTISGDGNDSGIYLYSNGPAAAPAVVRNTLTATASTGTGDGDGTGIFVTDDGSFFAESSGGNSFATISGNTISGFFRGVDLFRNEDTPAGGFAVNVTIDGNNEITGANTAVRVFDSNGTTAADAVASIVGNGSAGLHGNAVAIEVAGGTVTVTNNRVYDNGVGVRVRDGGLATINNNDFDGGADDNATDVHVAATAPGGIAGGAMSGNAFGADSFIVDNESAQDISALASAGNTFSGLGNFRVEDRMHHRSDSDRASAGRVSWASATVFVTDPLAGTGSTDSSIQYAVDSATAGDTVSVESGTYAQTVTVNKTLTLKGAQAGVDARTRTGAAETIVNAAGGGFSIAADGVVIDGFTVRDATTAPLGAGVYLSPSFSGYQVLNNIVTNNTFGLYLNSGGASQTVVRHNLFDSNNQTGSSSGKAIYADLGSKNVLIDANKFAGHASAAADFAGAAGTQQDITFTANQLVGDGSVMFSNTVNPRVTDNTMDVAAGAAVVLDGGNTDALVDNNVIDTGTGGAISSTGGSGLTVSNNTINADATDFTGNRTLVNLTNVAGASLVERNLLTVTGALTGTNTFFHGINVGGASTGTVTVRNNELNGNNVDTVPADQSSGVRLRSDLPATAVIDVLNNKLIGFVNGVWADVLAAGADVDVFQNDLAGNSNLAVRAAATGAMLDASTNWWGGTTAAIVIAAANGGVNVDHNPWLGDGTDTTPDRGFQPNSGPLLSSGISISGAPTTDEGDEYTLTLNDDGTNGTITGWTIDWGDAIQTVTGNPASVTHTYADGPEGFTISASATNDQSQTFASTTTVGVSVENVAPTVTATGAAAVSEGSVYTLTLGPVVDPGTDTVTNYRVDWGDGNVEVFTAAQVAAANRELTHTYADDNPTATPSDPYAISVDVQDEDSGANYHEDAGAAGVTVNNVAPTAAINGAPTTSPEGTLVSLTSGVTDPGSGDTFAYAWSVTKNGNAFASGAAQDFSFTPNDDGTYVVSLTVTDDDGGAGTASQQSVSVSNVAPRVAVSGAATVNEGSSYTLNLGAVTDPGSDTVTRYIINWGDGEFTDVTGNPANTAHAHTFDDGNSTRSVTVSLFDEDAAPHQNAGTPDPFAVSVNNVAPTANFFNGGTVTEGSNGFVGFGAQTDPSSADTAAGFRYSYDYNNDGDFTDAGELSDVVNASVGVPAVYLNDGPGSRTVRGRIRDKDGGFTDYTTTINIVNVVPFVNGGPDINASANTTFTQNGNFVDPGADSPWTGMVDYDWHPGDNDAVPLALNGFNFTLSNIYGQPGTYTIRAFVTDSDGATGHDDVLVNVGGTPSFQVNQFLFNPSGFTLRFNRAVDTAPLNLYDGIDGITPSNQPPDLELVGNNTGPVRGSLVWDPATNVATFVRTGGTLPVDTYTLTVRSGATRFRDTLGNALDGNADGTGGDDYTTSFNVTTLFDRTLSIPDFARGPDAAGNVNVPNTAALGIPVRIDDGAQVRSVDFTLNYNPSLLNISSVQLADGLPGDWAVTSNLTQPGRAVVTVFGTSSDLPSGIQNLVKLVASVPNNAPYTAAGLLRFNNITVSRNDSTTLPTRGDSAVHKVVYFGDADADRAYTGFDSALISRAVVGLDSGFHETPLVDPIIVGDIDGSGSLSGIDASFVAQKAAGLPRSEIPDLPGVLPPLVNGGVDPFISAPTNAPGSPGNTSVLPINIDDAQNTLGFNVTLGYDTNLLDVLDDTSGTSPAVTLGSLFSGAGGWSMTANVDDASGRVTLVFFRSNGQPMPAGGGAIANVGFAVKPSVADGTVAAIDVGGTETVGGLTFTHGDGSILVDAVRPSVLARNYKYQIAPHALEFTFSENVAASLAAGDFTVVNNTTSTTIPSSDFTLAYNTTTNTATLTYTPSGGVLPDGNYTVTVGAAGVTDPAGNAMAADEVFTFFFLMADANHDGNVNLSDFNILAANFGQSPRDFTQADFTYDGLVNLADFNILAARFGMSLAPNGTISPPNGTAPSLPGRGAAGERASSSMTTPGSTTGATTGNSLGKIEGSLAIPPASPSRARGTKAGAASTARASRSPSSTTTASSQLGSTSRTATGARLATPFNDTLIALQQTSPRVA